MEHSSGSTVCFPGRTPHDPCHAIARAIARARNEPREAAPRMGATQAADPQGAYPKGWAGAAFTPVAANERLVVHCGRTVEPSVVPDADSHPGFGLRRSIGRRYPR